MTSITSLPGTAYLNSTLGLDTNGDGIVSAEELEASQEQTGRSQDPSVLVENAATGTGARIAELSVADLLHADAMETEIAQDDDTVSLFDVLDQIAVIVDRYRSLSGGGDADEGATSIDV